MKRSLPLILFLLCAAGFALGILELFKLRFEAGDVYPAYSSLRADPLGTSAFYESLEQMPGLELSRDFRMTDEFPSGRGLAYFHLAGDRRQWAGLSGDEFKEADAFVRSGGRLVIALYPEPTGENIFRFEDDSDETPKEGKPAEKSSPAKSRTKTSGKKKKKIAAAKPDSSNYDSMAVKWGVRFGVKKMTPRDDSTYEPVSVVNSGEDSLPESLDWHSGVVMTNLDKAWKVIYSRGKDAVLAERKLGSGTVVISTDSYFLSNEALLKARQPGLLAWLVGPCKSIMFDEAHFGIVDNPGVATLARKYRLQGAVLALLALAGLFIWKSSLGFGPVREEEEADASVAGRDSASGFVNLLRRHVAPKDVLAVCVEEWKKSQPRGGFSEARIRRVEAFMQRRDQLSPRGRDSVSDYQSVCKLLEKGAASAVSPEEDNIPPKI